MKCLDHDGASELTVETERNSRRILVVDDNRDAALSLAMILKLMGHDSRIAEDGLQAIQVASEYHPELVFLDIGMPRMNGYDACRAIRQLPGGDGMYIVALTGWGQDEDRRKSKDAGFDEHFTKPADPNLITQLLESLPRRDQA